MGILKGLSFLRINGLNHMNVSPEHIGKVGDDYVLIDVYNPEFKEKFEDI